MTPGRLRLLMNLWPPFRFAGIRVLEIADDWSAARVRLRRHWYNRNYVGTHFGGSLFAMTDPFWMILVMRQLGREYFVWDKAGEIEFIKASRDDVFAQFQIDPTRIDAIRAATAAGNKHLDWFETEIVNADGTRIATVRKQLYVRRKPATGGDRNLGDRQRRLDD